MINIFNLPKRPATYRGWEYDLWVTLNQHLRKWREFSIEDIPKLGAMIYLIKSLSHRLNLEPPTALLDEVSDFARKTARSQRAPHKSYTKTSPYWNNPKRPRRNKQ